MSMRIQSEVILRYEDVEVVEARLELSSDRYGSAALSIPVGDVTNEALHRFAQAVLGVAESWKEPL
jgi:hypothetical protein